MDAFAARLEATQRRAEEAIGLRPEDLEAVRLTLGESPAKGVAVAALDSGQQELLRALLAVYVERVPEALADAEAEKYAGDRLLALHSRGPAASSLANPTTTGCRGHASWSSTTTRSGASTRAHGLRAIRTGTSAATSWPSTTPRTTAPEHPVGQLSTAVARCQTCRSSSISAPVPPGGITSGSLSRSRTTAT